MQHAAAIQQPTTHARQRNSQPRDSCSSQHSMQGGDYKHIPCAPPNGFINKSSFRHSRAPYTALHVQNAKHQTSTCYTAHIKINICFTQLHHSSAITLLVLLLPQERSTNYKRYIGNNISSSTPHLHTAPQTKSCCVRMHHRRGIRHSSQNQKTHLHCNPNAIHADHICP